MRISCRAEKKREAGNCDAHIQAHTWFIVDNRKNQTACPRQVRMSSLALLMDFKWNVSVGTAGHSDSKGGQSGTEINVMDAET